MAQQFEFIENEIRVALRALIRPVQRWRGNDLIQLVVSSACKVQAAAERRMCSNVVTTLPVGTRLLHHAGLDRWSAFLVDFVANSVNLGIKAVNADRSRFSEEVDPKHRIGQGKPASQMGDHPE